MACNGYVLVFRGTGGEMAIPKTKTSDVVEEALIADRRTNFFLEADLQWHRWMREIAPLKEINRAEWDSAAGVLFSIVGRFDEAHRCFENSLLIEYSPMVLRNFLQSKIACGQYLEAQALYSKYGHPSQGNFERLFRTGVESGAYEVAITFSAAARKMGLEVPTLREPPEEIVELLRSEGISDVDLARHLEAAGKICSRHRVKTQIKRMVAGNDKPVMMTLLFVVPKSGDEVFEMNMELAQAEEEMGIVKRMAVDVAFVESLPSDITEAG